MKPRVIIESPLAGRGDTIEEKARDKSLNVLFAKACMRDSILRGEAPFASHLLYDQPGILDDLIPEERNLGIECGLEWAGAAWLVAVYVDRGVTPGMHLGIERHLKNGRTVEQRRLSDSRPELFRRIIEAMQKPSFFAPYVHLNELKERKTPGEFLADVLGKGTDSAPVHDHQIGVEWDPNLARRMDIK